jgi:hypothetical protein
MFVPAIAGLRYSGLAKNWLKAGSCAFTSLEKPISSDKLRKNKIFFIIDCDFSS